ncbi:MAG: sugar ABC transporter permease [Anaerolineae bacterium]|nr:sugar ABC transporter permease [Anaerolineae bacterium]
MPTDTDLRFERWWMRAAAIFSAVLIVGFFAAEFSGLIRLGEWLANGIAGLPAAVEAVLAHYAALTPAMLLIPLLIGGGVGAAATWFAVPGVHRSRHALIGAGLGALSGQMLTAGLRHCTYAPEAPPGEQIAGFALTALSALALLLPAWTLMRGGTGGAAGTFRSPWTAYLLLAPTLLSLGLFLYLPGIQTAALSLSLRRFPLPQERFVCLGNYAALTADPIYQNSFVTTLAITAAIVAISLTAALGIAVLASQKVRFIAVYRAVLIAPFALSPVVSGVIFLALFREGSSGVLSALLIGLFGGAPNWLRDPSIARWVIVAASVWNILGFNILFYLAGLQNVPRDLLEAAQIDGANRAQRFLRVTLPLLSPYTFFLLIANVTYGFYGVYGAVDALTQGGPPLGAAGQLGGATDMLIYKLYQDAFSPGSPVGLAAAQAVVLFILVAGLTLLQFGRVERRVTYGG